MKKEWGQSMIVPGVSTFDFPNSVFPNVTTKFSQLKIPHVFDVTHSIPKRSDEKAVPYAKHQLFYDSWTSMAKSNTKSKVLFDDNIDIR